MKIRIFGMPTDTGVGTHSRKICESLSKIATDKIQVEWLSKYEMQKLADAMGTSADSDINVFLFYTPGLTKLYRGVHLFWYAFESTVPMLDTAVLLKEFHLIISPSAWGRDCLMQNGVPPERVFVVPEGVDPWMYYPSEKQERKSEKIKFLMVGKFETRKGYVEAIKAFDIAYRRNLNIELLVKPDWVDGQKSRLSSAFIKLVLEYNYLPIRTINSILHPTQMRELYCSADYFLFPSRCEGWGLPLIEAIACGVPAICCEFGGQSEYLSAIPGGFLPIPYELDDIDCEKWKKDFPSENGSWGKWAKVDPAKLADVILNACEMNLKKTALASSDLIRREFSWDNAAAKLISLVNAINNSLAKQRQLGNEITPLL